MRRFCRMVKGAICRMDSASEGLVEECGPVAREERPRWTRCCGRWGRWGEVDGDRARRVGIDAGSLSGGPPRCQIATNSSALSHHYDHSANHHSRRLESRRRPTPAQLLHPSRDSAAREPPSTARARIDARLAITSLSEARSARSVCARPTSAPNAKSSATPRATRHPPASTSQSASQQTELRR